MRIYTWIQRYGAAVITAALLTLAYPVTGAWPIAGIALVPYLVLIWRADAHYPSRHFLPATFLCIWLWHFASLWWISHVTCTGMLALITLIAFLYTLILWCARYFMPSRVPEWLSFMWGWLACEAVVTYFLTGFPWLLLGYAWSPWTHMIQIADIMGVYGVTVVILIVNYAVAVLCVSLMTRRSYLRAGVTSVAAVSICAASVLYGMYSVARLDAQKPQFHVTTGCVQANIPPLIKHDSTRDLPTLRTYVRLTDEVMQDSPDVVCWPETAIPGYYQDGLLAYRTIVQLLRRIDRPLITGMARYEYAPDGTLRYYNAVSVIETNGIISATYDKIHLVMFGEYVPFERYLPFLSLVTPIQGSYSSGERARCVPVTVDEHTVLFAPLICFEDVFSYLSRRMARRGANVLLNVTNEGWFHSSPGPFQHAALAAWRAIEVRRPLLRVTNTGITQLIDRKGAVQAEISKNGKKTECRGTLVCDIPVYADTGTTFYARNGDWLLVAGSGGLVLGCLATVIARLRASKA